MDKPGNTWKRGRVSVTLTASQSVRLLRVGARARSELGGMFVKLWQLRAGFTTQISCRRKTCNHSLFGPMASRCSARGASAVRNFSRAIHHCLLFKPRLRFAPVVCCQPTYPTGLPRGLCLPWVTRRAERCKPILAREERDSLLIDTSPRRTSHIIPAEGSTFGRAVILAHQFPRVRVLEQHTPAVATLRYARPRRLRNQGMCVTRYETATLACSSRNPTTFGDRVLRTVRTSG